MWSFKNVNVRVSIVDHVTCCSSTQSELLTCHLMTLIDIDLLRDQMTSVSK